ncbi:imidazole glycerol phosphate synthase subunit HisH [Silvibacterium dinghuense]|uniref:Imidazole glycerol phosphate synthase subunit HisH n=1 Tax=Silvibacterium dinghuense TaxID=1560006 RepID=A0A4V1NW22_9BACT|nr:imidazole glycerol phosphate synthase subunit HisH [Silvibacterium dinghuense]RXS97912.1 imidazole glycerol phosphate synthase subunit HisH [Silvibacterium dinghuense]GGH02940.1 imidazole glycerol phosphate synthase subunit HisH [Silvibacterium dinghuense]
MIAVIDYKAGNLTSVIKALRAVEAHPQVTEDPEVVRRASKIVLPGVGHFSGTAFLEQHGLKQAIAERVAEGVPLLGICVGLQWLYQGSTEAPDAPGFGFFPAMCSRFEGGGKVPHVGWNAIAVKEGSRLLASVPDGSFVYFTHSFRAPVTAETVGTTEYGGAFTAAAERDHVMGVQFHPEKSGVTGLRILRNFVEIPC